MRNPFTQHELGYFITDTVVSEAMGFSTPIFRFHHILVCVIIFRSFNTRVGLSEQMTGLLMTESSNPFMLMRLVLLARGNKGVAVSICDAIFPSLWILNRHMFGYWWATKMASCREGDTILYVLATSVLVASMVWTMMILYKVAQRMCELFPRVAVFKSALGYIARINAERRMLVWASIIYSVSLLVPQAIARYL